jgi:RNA polymerase sigma factor for flagellar operon FliA
MGSARTRAPRRSSAAQDRLVEQYLPLVRHVVARIAATLPAHVDGEELFQVGSIGLLNASRSFDPRRGVSFKTYAFALIRGAVLDELRRLDLVPRSTREKIRAMDAASARLAQQLGRTPSNGEVADALGARETDVERLRTAVQAMAMTSLEERPGVPDALLVRDILPSPDALDPSDAAARVELLERVARGIQALPEAERRVITMYYREGLLLREIGEVLGVTESRVSQIHASGVARLKAALAEAR